MTGFEDKLRRAAMEDRDVGYEATPKECLALADAVEALREIASPDELVNVNEDAFSVHAFRRAQEIANWALARLDAA